MACAIILKQHSITYSNLKCWHTPFIATANKHLSTCCPLLALLACANSWKIVHIAAAAAAFHDCLIGLFFQNSG